MVLLVPGAELPEKAGILQGQGRRPPTPSSRLITKTTTTQMFVHKDHHASLHTSDRRRIRAKTAGIVLKSDTSTCSHYAEHLTTPINICNAYPFHSPIARKKTLTIRKSD